MKPVESVYIHVPFCRHRCGYCNFTLVAGRDDLVDVYLTALEQEIAGTLLEPKPVNTIFLGGGTPSYLSTAQLVRLSDIVNRWFEAGVSVEFSCEVNPLDCEPDKLNVLKDAGVNRISIGGQSFSDRKLRVLERDHSGEQLRAVVEMCADMFSNVSLDLIFAAPEESEREWQADVESMLVLPLSHASTYGLTIERGSAFYGRLLRDTLAEVDADHQLAMYEYAIERITREDGWEHYEVSSFCKKGQRCRHNEVYWQGEPWWAFGPGAASFLPQENAELPYVRRVNHRSSTTYIRRQLAGRSVVAEEDGISFEQHIRERLVFGLRQIDGILLDELSDAWGQDVRQMFEPELGRFIDAGWLAYSPDSRLKLTPKGLVISDSLWPDLLVGER